MRVALLTDGIWPYAVGGMQKHSYYLCKYLALSGVKVDIYSVEVVRNEVNSSSIFSSYELENIEFYFVKWPSLKYFPGHYAYSSWKYSKSIYQVLLPRLNLYDLIYVQGFSGWYFLNRKHTIVDSPLPPVILNMHGLNMYQAPASFKSYLENIMFRAIVGRQLRRADYIQSFGGCLTEILLSRGIEEHRIWECGIGIEAKWASGWEKSKLKRSFVYIGRFERLKGIKELNIAIGELIKERCDFVFHFIGPIPEEVRIRDSRVFYHGLLIGDELIAKILRESDFLILPSYSEGMPTVILEAMACGCAIIATNVGAINKMVSEENGFLISKPDVALLTEAMKKAIGLSFERLDSMKSASADSFRKTYLWENLVIKMISFFKEAKSLKSNF